MTVVSMSDEAFFRLDVLMDIEAGRVAVRDARRRLGLRRRQVFRLLAGFRAQGGASLISKRRGRPSNNRLSGNQLRQGPCSRHDGIAPWRRGRGSCHYRKASWAYGVGSSFFVSPARSRRRRT
jgi:Winged helix-turn helix